MHQSLLKDKYSVDSTIIRNAIDLKRFKEIDPKSNITEYHNLNPMENMKLTKDQIKKINKVYEIDFKTFNYKIL